MGTSWNRDCQQASRNALKDFTDDALTISAGSLFQTWNQRFESFQKCSKTRCGGFAISDMARGRGEELYMQAQSGFSKFIHRQRGHFWCLRYGEDHSTKIIRSPLAIWKTAYWSTFSTDLTEVTWIYPQFNLKYKVGSLSMRKQTTTK